MSRTREEDDSDAVSVCSITLNHSVYTHTQYIYIFTWNFLGNIMHLLI